MAASRITSLSELRRVLDFASKSPEVAEIFSRMKHVNGEWDREEIKLKLTSILAAQPDKALYFVTYTDNEPTALFFGFISNDFVSGKRGVNELLWFSMGKNPIGGVKVFRAVENFIKENDLDFLSCSYLSNGGTMGLPAFYARNDFALDSLTFIKNYK